jgi:opacity protein-like surface antigen
LLVCLLLAFATSLASAQNFEVAPFIGYRLGGSVKDLYTGQTHRLADSQSEGVTVSFPLAGGPNYAELLYSHQGATVDVNSASGVKRAPLSVDYWMLGGVRDFSNQGDRARPFLASYLGMTHFSTSDGSIGSANRFSFAVGGGVKLDLSPHVGLRFDARGYLTFVSTSGGMFCGPYGCGASFTGSGFFQGEGTGSLLIKF